MKKIITSIFFLLSFLIGVNATNYYVDGSKADDSGNGQSWGTAKKTITAAHALGVAGDNVFVKAGTYSFSTTLWTNDRNFYGGFAGSETAPAERQTSDLDNNGIVEPWEFSNPTILNFTLTDATGLTFNARAAARNFDGFKITGTQTASTTGTTGTYIFGPNIISTVTNVVFQNNIISDITVTNTLTLAYTQGSIMQIYGNNVNVNNCLFEKNTVTLTAAASQLDYQQVPLIYLKASAATARNVMQNCIVRNNQVTIDYSATALTGVNNSRGLLIAIDCQATYPTTLKNTIVHNNDMTFIPKTGSTYSLGNAGAVTNYAAANSQSDSVINCTIAYNKGIKIGCAGLKIGIQYNNFQYPYVKIFNNVCYNNAVDGSIGTMGNLTLSAGAATLLAGGIQIANNYANGGADQIVENSTIVTGNVKDMATDNNDATKGAKFISPTTVTGYNAALAASKWTIGTGSYLIAKGIVTTNKYDKAGVIFATTPSVGAYEGGDVVIPTSGTQNISLTTSLKSLTVNPGAKLTLNNNVFLTVGSLNLLSDATNGTGTFVDQNANGGLTVTGTSTVNQSLQAASALRTWYITPPVASATPTPALSIIKYFDETLNTGTATDNWVSTSSMLAQKGYQVVPVAGNDISFSGTLNTGNQNIALTSRTGTANFAGFNLIGNPYPSYLDWNLVTANSGNLALMRSTTMWYRTKSAGVYSFWTVNGDGVTSPNGASPRIPPMQAFWVRANAGGGSLALTNAMRSHAPATDLLFKVPAAKNTANTLVRLQVSNGTNTDEAVLYLSANASNGLDTYDAPKMSNNNVAIPEIYTTVGAEQMVINAMNTLTLDTPIGLGFVPGNATSFSLTANQISNLPAGVKVILKDNVTTTETDLTDGISTYQFSPLQSSSDRFSVIFRSAGAVTNVEAPQDNSLIVYNNAPQQLTVVFNDLPAGSILSVYNAIGQKLLSQQLTSTRTQIAGEFRPGVYMLKVNNTTKKVIVN